MCFASIIKLTGSKNMLPDSFFFKTVAYNKENIINDYIYFVMLFHFYNSSVLFRSIVRGKGIDLYKNLRLKIFKGKS